jgi:hypothetical protein
MSAVYSRGCAALADEAAKAGGIARRRSRLLGPSYEAQAEILRTIGADAVRDAVCAGGVFAGADVQSSLSCITNMAAGVLRWPLNHAGSWTPRNAFADSSVNAAGGRHWPARSEGRSSVAMVEGPRAERNFVAIPSSPTDRRDKGLWPGDIIRDESTPLTFYAVHHWAKRSAAETCHAGPDIHALTARLS